MLVPDSAWAAFELPTNEFKQWQRSLLYPALPRRYSSDRHTDARMHLGGIGTGNFEIGADGQLTTWQLCHNLRDGIVPFFFAIKGENSARLLQTVGGPEWPRIKHIEMTGEYPVGSLRFEDEDLPVAVELTAFSPFSPLNVDLSSTPVAVFSFRLHNPSAQTQKVSLAAFMTNPVGYASIGRIEECQHPCLGANVNESFQEGRAAGFVLSAHHGREPSVDRPVTICVPKDLFAMPPDPHSGDKNHAYVAPRDLAMPPLDRPEALKVEVVDEPHVSADSPPTVIWLEDTTPEIPTPFLRSARDAVRAGAILVFSGRSMPLVNAYANAAGGEPLGETTLRPDIVFENFESGYGKWKVEGAAFGAAPAHGGFEDQQPVSGFLGQGFVNSFLGGDDTTGKLTSETFVIDRHFIRFLVGGGHYRETQIRLVCDGHVERATSGKDNERLESAVWDVRELSGRAAHIEIVDNQKGGWGHINVDQIVFSDASGDRETMDLLGELLPIRCHRVREGRRSVEFEGLKLCPGTEETAGPAGLTQFTRAYGAGKVVLIAGQLLDSAHTDSTRVRQEAYSILCGLAGATYMMTQGQSAKATGFGSLALAVLAEKATGLASFEDWSAVWEQFRTEGMFQPLEGQSGGPTPAGRTTNCALAATVSVPPGGTLEIPFLLTWHYPNNYSAAGAPMGCFYATQWANARAVMKAAAGNYDAWRAETELFRRTFYDSTLPYWLLDAITANAAITRHIGVVFRIANGDVYGWEGSNGSCQPTCTHVWGYEQALAHLFPDLEKEMRRIDFKHQQDSDGGIHNRTEVPSPPHPTGERPFSDGHASCILKAYREALNSPGDSFFREYWPDVKRAVEYLIARDQAAAGGAPAGVLQDDQWNTYDEALHGVTTFISGYYLAALRAAEEWARRLGDTEAAGRFRAIFESGRAKLVELCWNGEYFEQHLPDYAQRQGEVGPGCISDQLIGQWWAHQLGLGYILPEDKVKSALRAIFKYNFKSDLTGWKHSPRAFAGVKDKGLIICTWPKGGRPPNVMLYSDEVWTGVEYQVAAHMIYEGFVDEAFAIIKGARDRYDGLPRPPIGRNPWCEIECGGHYTRAMSSWSLLLALSGCQYDGTKGLLRFAPRFHPEQFRSFFSGPEGWGYFAQEVTAGKQRASFGVNGGQVSLQALRLGLVESVKVSEAAATISGRAIPVSLQIKDGHAQISFGGEKITVHRGEKLEVTLS